jgi:hypothetical protein
MATESIELLIITPNNDARERMMVIIVVIIIMCASVSMVSGGSIVEKGNMSLVPYFNLFSCINKCDGIGICLHRCSKAATCCPATCRKT